MGRLINSEVWRARLSAHLLTGLDKWIMGQAFDLRHRRWLSGLSGSYVAIVQVEPEHSTIAGGILKLVPPELAIMESRGVRLAEQYTPRAFYDAHLVRTSETGPITDDGWWLHLQELAQINLARMMPLSALIDDASFPEYCARIIAAATTEWNPRRDDLRPRSAAASTYLAATVHDRTDGLARFAAEAGLSLDSPATDLAFPDRTDRLPNPLALLNGSLVASGEILVYRGNGHGDLNIDNVLLPVDPEVRANEFRLVDLGRFSPETPLSRDAVKLLISVVLAWLRNLPSDSAMHADLANQIVAPGTGRPLGLAARCAELAQQVHTAAAGWAVQRHLLLDDWYRQHLLVLIGAALRTVGRPDLSTSERWWALELSAVASRSLLAGDGAELVSSASTRPPVTGVPHMGTVTSNDDQHYPGSAKLLFCRRLGGDWTDLADLLGVQPYEIARFSRGQKPRGIWDWLVERGRLGELRGALITIGRADLADVLDEAM